MLGMTIYELYSRIEILKKRCLLIIKIKKILYFSIFLITLHRLKWHTNLITFEKPMKTVENILWGIKIPSPITT